MRKVITFTEDELDKKDVQNEDVQNEDAQNEDAQNDDSDRDENKYRNSEASSEDEFEYERK